MEKTFQLHILAVDRALYEGACLSLTVPLADGRLGLLAGHSPMAAAVVPGILRCRLGDGTELRAVTGGGILRFADNDALLLLDSVARAEELDAQRERRAVEQAREALRGAATEREKLRLRGALAAAEARYRAASGEV